VHKRDFRAMTQAAFESCLESREDDDVRDAAATAADSGPV